MSHNRSNSRDDNSRNRDDAYDNDSFGSASSRGGRGGSWSNRDDNNTLNSEGRDRHGGRDRYAAGSSYNQRDDEDDDDRRDYYGNRRTSQPDDSGQPVSDRYTGREGGSNQFSSWRNDPSDVRGGSETSGWSGGTQNAKPARTQSGQHAGRGPKGYRRDDARVTEDVNERLTHDSHLDASEIEVSVTNGEVTLSGTVDSRDAKRHAEDIVETVSGVSDVNNLLRVAKKGGAV